MCARLVGVDRRRVDDRAARTQMRLGRLHQIEHRMDVRGERLLPFLIRDVAELFETGLVRGIVDENIEAAKLADGAIDNRSTVSGVADVPGHQHDLSSGFLDKTRGFLRILILAEIGNEKVSAFACECDRNRPSDAAVAALL
jgi:hypothetical protein